MNNDLTKMSIQSDTLAPADVTIPTIQMGFEC